MVLRVPAARAELFQTRGVIRWNNGEEDVLFDDHRTSFPISNHHVGSDGGTGQPR
jgi:hypothetical protein